MRLPAAALGLLLTACREVRDPGVVDVDVSACQPVPFGSVVGFTLRADAPALAGGSRYRCLIFPGSAEHRVQLTVFAQGFRPAVYLLNPGEPHRLLAWSDTGPGVDVARTSATLPRTTPYAAIVAATPGEAGTFLISIQDR